MKRYWSETGLQVFAIRDLLRQDAVATFTKISEIGIQNIEFFDPATLSEYVPIVRDLGMTPLCSHFLPGYITGKWDTATRIEMAPPADYGFENVLEDCYENGINNLGIAIMMPEDRETFDDYLRFANKVNRAAEECQAAGIQLYYHNHSFEFEHVGGTTPMEEMIKIFDEALVKIEFDVFWAKIAGEDPLHWMDRLDNRILFLHLKDLKQGMPVDHSVFEVSHEAFVELGTGIINFKEILRKARSMDIQKVFLDQDHTKLEKMESIQRNHHFLTNLKIPRS